MLSTFARNAIILGLIVAVGPFAIDMYLPALPTIAADLGASTAAAQMTLMVFFVAFGVLQIFYGPISDMVGRRPPLYFGLAVFAVGSIGAASSPTLGWLIAFRFVQGVGAASLMVIVRAIIRDLHTGLEATRMMSTIMLVFSVSPILAPLAGSAMVGLFNWRVIFYALTVAAALGFLLAIVFLPETLPPARRVRSSFATVISGFGRLFLDWRFLGLTFIAALGMSSFFSFLASSSFIYIDHFGLTPTEFSLAFSVNAIGFIGSSQFSARLAQRFGFSRVITSATAGYSLMAVALFLVTLSGIDDLGLLMAMLFVAFACLGLVIPSSMVLALEDQGAMAGTASALGGTLQFVTGAVMIVVVSVFFDGTTLPMVTVIVVCAIGAFILTRLTLRQRELVPEPAE